MRNILPITQAAPAHWARASIRNHFTTVALAPMIGTKTNCAACAGDVVVHANRSVFSAELIKTDCEVELKSGMVILRSNGQMRPELLVALLNNPSVIRSIREQDSRMSNSVVGVSWNFLRDIELAVPDMAAQNDMVLAINSSTDWIIDYAKTVRRQTDTMIELGNSLFLEIFKGNLDRKQALMHVAQAVRPMLRLVDQDKDTSILSACDIAKQSDTDQKYVKAEDHLSVVARLKEQIRTLKDQTPEADQPLPKAPKIS